MSPAISRSVLDALSGIPDVELCRQAPLAPLSTFRLGGAAEVLAEIGTEGAVAAVLEVVRAAAVPFQILGLGSNVLIPDEGLPGVVARLAGEMLQLSIDGEIVHAGAALPLARLATSTARQGLCGLEALSGFPSTVGGAVLMNAGCYGTEICDLLLSTRVVDGGGRASELTVADLDPGYRSTNLQGSGSVVVAATFRLEHGDAAGAVARIEELNKKRWASLPTGQPQAGSIFRNPTGDFAGRLIEACSLKGERRGGAQISPKHANVIVNTGAARAADVLELMILARRRVAASFDLVLEPEIILTGGLARRWREAAVR